MEGPCENDALRPPPVWIFCSFHSALSLSNSACRDSTALTPSPEGELSTVRRRGETRGGWWEAMRAWREGEKTTAGPLEGRRGLGRAWEPLVGGDDEGGGISVWCRGLVAEPVREREAEEAIGALACWVEGERTLPIVRLVPLVAVWPAVDSR